MKKKRLGKTLRRSTSFMPKPVPLDWEDASEQCTRILETIDELEEDGVIDKAPEFFESVGEKIASMQGTIDRKQRVSEKQQEALDNMERGVNAWVR